MIFPRFDVLVRQTRPDTRIDESAIARTAYTGTHLLREYVHQAARREYGSC
jgi:hypothetical protein